MTGYISSSVLGIIIWWIKDGLHFSSEYVASQITELYR
nr:MULTISPECIES: TetR-like C-terminal domain-containing protein [unclassified Bacillus (in: firmicutes)]